MTTTRGALAPLQASDFDAAFPNSRKLYIEERGVRVPMREISLGGGEEPLRVYDTSGPHGVDVREGLPQLRRDWILARAGVVEGPRTHALEDPGARGAISPALARRAAAALKGTGAVT